MKIKTVQLPPRSLLASFLQTIPLGVGGLLLPRSAGSPPRNSLVFPTLSWRRPVTHRPTKHSLRALHSASLSSPMQPAMENDGVPWAAPVLLTSTFDWPVRSPRHFGQPARQSAIQTTRPWSTRRRAVKTGRPSRRHHGNQLSYF